MGKTPKDKKPMNISLISVFLLVGALSNTPKGKRITVKAEEADESIVVKEAPYFTALSLGDELSSEGLIVRKNATSEVLALSELEFLNYDTLTLGAQEVSVLYNKNVTTFDVFVTNRFVKNYAPSIQEVFISEVLYLDNVYGVELYNGTLANVDLTNYALMVEGRQNVVIPLSGKTIKSKETITITNTNTIISNPSMSNNNLSFVGNTGISLVKDGDIIGGFDFSLIEKLTEATSGVFRRNTHVYKPLVISDKYEWIYARDDIANFGAHTYAPAVISVSEQAKAFARYVMFGAGMNALGRIEEAFHALEEEYNLMSAEAQAYFANNKDVKVMGINEAGKSETVSFRSAHERIALLASRSGHNSFIKTSSKTSINPKIFIFSGLGVLVIIGYAVILFVRKHHSKPESIN